ncbi:Uncharacterized protein FWK35_00035711 [Aphis craccivora]|uniref:Uncharacterized protein n=1 Tax=Aphis craccivora TaxID=307492 RepID=A0A6G0VPS4_APHCR|nr:Uncharacterized protein FWK35_00035711 [Aphis craccivora]
MVCHVCLNTSFGEEIIVIINLPTDDLIFLQDIIENYNFSPSNCENCNINMTQSLDFIEHLIIEPVVSLTKQRKVEKHLDLNIQLKDIPNILKIRNEFYYLYIISACTLPLPYSLSPVTRSVT